VNFATLVYAAFLLVVVAIHWLLPRRARRYWLIAASLFFYGSWNPAYVPGLIVLVLINWYLGLMAAHRPRIALVIGVTLNLGILGFFKYTDWLLGTTARLLGPVTGAHTHFGPMGIALPLAVSFVTFTLIAYIIDTARGARAERHLDRFALFVTFFPHLISGPIMRGRELLPQVRHPRPFRMAHFREALPLLVSGLLKKTVGDSLAPTVQAVFSHPEVFSSGAIWIGVLAFGFQIYFDFSGYTDLALGSARLLGMHLPSNFNWPYRAVNLQDFWRRWHMTLSRWLRDYLYIPLGGSRRGPARTYFAIATTMLLGGLWHGAGLTFIIWGAWHGIGLVALRWWRQRSEENPTPPWAGWLLTFLFVQVGWIFFRAPNVHAALGILERALSFQAGQSISGFMAAACLVLVAGQWPGWAALFRRAAPARSYRRYATYGAALALTVAFLPVNTVQFIYFQF
jgi:alginate O-acetyltransferase complex protein AlgI